MQLFSPTRITLFTLAALALAMLTACATPPPANPTPIAPTTVTAVVQSDNNKSCPVSETVWVKPPQDAAIPDEPAFGNYYQNEDATIMAAAWWKGIETEYLRAGGNGIKTGWFRPEGAPLEITGERLDGSSPEPFHADIPCCYPTRFQASGLYFPTEGCWRITAKAAASELSFVVRVAPYKN